MNEYTPDQMEHRAITDDLSTGQYRIMHVNEEAARREKAALFDAMAAMRDIEVTQGKSTWAIWRERGRTVTLLGSGATLADAVKAAMEAMEAEKAKASSRLRTDPADWKAGR